MGGQVQFHRALGRRPLPKWLPFAGASGPQKGITADQWAKSGVDIPWEVVVLCTSSDDPVGAYAKLSTEIDTHGALDLLDIQEVKRSWMHAELLNNEVRRDGH